jgi:hypothetical protein
MLIRAKYEQRILDNGSLEAEKYRRIYFNIKLYFMGLGCILSIHCSNPHLNINSINLPK